MGRFVYNENYGFLTIKLDYSFVHTYGDLDIAVSDIQNFIKSGKEVTFDSRAINISKLKEKLSFNHEISNFKKKNLFELRHKLLKKGYDFSIEDFL
ncbi:hypothetical protein KY321_00170 [Candidatus Woesearchaeota archaeon]|nr:hypothetical protein [Candidatus Woesearchaeota archaeon]